eukprot:m.77155 g.77155  ORF g.77155 m.77155 type:complete len:68 (+) comp12504_c0_seq1:653-856(+)
MTSTMVSSCLAWLVDAAVALLFSPVKRSVVHQLGDNQYILKIKHKPHNIETINIFTSYFSMLFFELL